MLERPLALRRHHSAHESWEGLHQVADRDGSLRLRLKGLILLSAAGGKIPERKNAAAQRHAKRAAALLRQLTKMPDRAFEHALGVSPRRSLNAPKRLQGFPLNYKRRLTCPC
jgi:hypothetical protein